MDDGTVSRALKNRQHDESRNMPKLCFNTFRRANTRKYEAVRERKTLKILTIRDPIPLSLNVLT